MKSSIFSLFAVYCLILFVSVENGIAMPLGWDEFKNDTDFLPNEEALKALNALINYGVGIGKISDDYHVIGHRQARNTLCPGEEFYKYVQEHPRWTPRPIPIYTNSTTTTTETVTVTNKNIASTCK